MAIRKIVIDNKQNDIYEIICDFFGYHHTIHGNEVTNRLLLVGDANIDLRCIVFSYSWDNNKEFANYDLLQYDGLKTKTEDYIVNTVKQEEINASIRLYAERWLLCNGETITNIELVGKDETVEAVISVTQ